MLIIHEIYQAIELVKAVEVICLPDDIQVRFYQETEDGVCWEAFGEFMAQDIHRQVGL